MSPLFCDRQTDRGQTDRIGYSRKLDDQEIWNKLSREILAQIASLVALSSNVQHNEDPKAGKIFSFIEYYYRYGHHWSLHICEDNDCITIPCIIPGLLKWGKPSSSQENRHSLRKKVFLTPKKVKIWPQKKSLFPNPLGHVHFAKNQVKFGIFWPLEPHLQSTAAYRGSPPCAIFHNPDNKEI